MHTITLRRNVAHGWVDLFRLVLDVKKYPCFVPFCRSVRLMSRSSEGAEPTVIVSRMTVGFPPVEVSYANRTVGDAVARRIEVRALDGPLRSLHAVWKFEPRGENSTDVEFSVRYEFSSRLLAVLASGVLDQMFGRIIDAFEQRADRLRAASGVAATTTSSERLPQGLCDGPMSPGPLQRPTGS